MKDYLMLINKDNLFSQDMMEGVEFVDAEINSSPNKAFVEAQTFKAFEALKKELDKSGIVATLNSAGRTIDEQQQTLDEAIKQVGEIEAKKNVAVAGASEHHTGLALDVRLKRKNAKDIRNVKYVRILDRMIMYAKMNEILEKYGFILRYTKDKSEITGFNPEFWHIRYVGVEHAKEMKQTGMCLEEYVAKINQVQDGLSVS